MRVAQEQNPQGNKFEPRKQMVIATKPNKFKLCVYKWTE